MPEIFDESRLKIMPDNYQTEKGEESDQFIQEILHALVYGIIISIAPSLP
jgi:hypothetical protein